MQSLLQLEAEAWIRSQEDRIQTAVCLGIGQSTSEYHAIWEHLMMNLDYAERMQEACTQKGLVDLAAEVRICHMEIYNILFSGDGSTSERTSNPATPCILQSDEIGSVTLAV